MDIFDTFFTWIERRKGGVILRNFWQFYSPKEDPEHRANLQLRRSGTFHSLRFVFETKRKIGGFKRENVIIYFRHTKDLEVVLDDIDKRIEHRTPPTGEGLSGLRGRALTMLRGKLIRDYGRIDQHPQDKHNVELALVRIHDKYQLFFTEKGQKYFCFPVDFIPRFRKFLPEIHRLMSASRRRKTTIVDLFR